MWEGARALDHAGPALSDGAGFAQAALAEGRSSSRQSSWTASAPISVSDEFSFLGQCLPLASAAASDSEGVGRDGEKGTEMEKEKVLEPGVPLVDVAAPVEAGQATHSGATLAESGQDAELLGYI